MDKTAVLLETHDLRKEFGGLVAVDNVSIQVERGSTHSIIGPNGAGKTTFFNLLTGQYKPTRGTVLFKGEDITHLPVHRRAHQGIGRSFQITNIFPNLTVLENVRLAVQALHSVSFRFWQRTDSFEQFTHRALDILDRLGLAEMASTPANVLPHGGKRKLELAILLAADTELLLLDEPTAGMASEQVPELIQIIGEISASGDKTIVMVEHNMNVVMGISDRITVMSSGRVLTEGTPAVIAADKTVQSVYLGGLYDLPEERRVNLLEVRDIHTNIGQFHILEGVSVSVAEGSITVLLGRNGAGKTTTLKSIMGMTPPARGSVEFAGQPLKGKRPYNVAQLGIGYVPEHRAIFRELSVAENLRIAERRPGDLARKADFVFELFPDLQRFYHLPGGSLSGGQQQMLAIARALVPDNRLLLIDEPSEGLAPVIIEHLMSAIRRLAAHTTVLLVEQNFRMASRLADRYVIIDNGRSPVSGSMADLVRDEALVQRYLGVA